MADLRMGGEETAPPASRQELEALATNVDHYDPVFLGHRVEMFRLMHAQDCPIRHSTNHDGYWFITGYPEAVEVQRRAEEFSNKDKVVPRRPVPDLIPSSLDPPVHKPVKIALTRLFLPSAIADLRTKLIQTARRLFDQCTRGRSEFDVVQELMFPLMGEFTMVDMLGLDRDNAMRFASVIHAQTRPVPDAAHVARMRQDLAALEDEFRQILHDRSYDPASMLARIAELDIGGRHFTVDEMIKVAFNLTIGGFGTTAAFTGSAFVFLARNPELRRQIVVDPGIIPTAFDEMLRLMTPTQTFARRVERDTEIGGVKIKAGEQLLMGYGAANFDPRQFPNPEEVDLRRSPNRHMGFGTGPHRCLGEPIARLVVGEVLTLMATHIPDYELVEDGVIAQSFGSSMFGYSNVPIRF